jgi:hypothetical protein
VLNEYEILILRGEKPWFTRSKFFTNVFAQWEIRMSISLNEPITFGRNGTATDLKCSGVDFSEDGHRSWTSAPVADFDLQLPFSKGDLLLRLEATPFLIPDVVPVQNVFVFCGGFFVGYCSLLGHAVRTFPLSRNVISARTIRLSLVIPTAVSPDTLHISDDKRELGIYLSSIVFEAAKS